MKNPTREQETDRIYEIPAFLIEEQVRSALKEDFGHGFDITSCSVIPADAEAAVNLTARENGTLSAVDCARTVFEILKDNVRSEFFFNEGEYVEKGDVIARFTGRARTVLSGERVALNYLGAMSGIATLTAKYVRAVSHTEARIACTRKTAPGLRMLQKRAVRAGGGFNHRQGLDDTVLIKDNHIAICGGVEKAVRSARAAIGHTVKIETECDTLKQVEEALHAGSDIIMADNMNFDQIRQAVKIINGKVPLEVSGGVNLQNVASYAEAGANIISVGALTHSAPCLDVAFDFSSFR